MFLVHLLPYNVSTQDLWMSNPSISLSVFQSISLLSPNKGKMPKWLWKEEIKETKFDLVLSLITIVGKHCDVLLWDDFSTQRYHKWLTVDQRRSARERSFECCRVNRWLHPLQGITLQTEEPWTFSLSYLSDLAQSEAMSSSHVLNTSLSVCVFTSDIQYAVYLKTHV